jgi:hypothetical protein
MFKRLKTLKKLWTLTNKNPEYLKAIETLSEKEIEAIPSKGNKKAEFIPLMTTAERDEYLKNKEPVWRKFNEKLKEIIK